MKQLVVIDEGQIEKILIFGLLTAERQRGEVSSDAPHVLMYIIGEERLVESSSLVLTYSNLCALFGRGCFTLDELKASRNIPNEICNRFGVEYGFYFDWDLMRLIISQLTIPGDPHFAEKYLNTKFPAMQILVFPDELEVSQVVYSRLIS